MDNKNIELAEDFRNSLSAESRFQEYLSLFLRGKWVILASMAIVAAVMVVYAMRMEPVYEATSMVLINPKGQSGSLPFADMMASSSPNKITNELGILKSRLMSERVGQALLQNPYLDAEAKHEMLPIVKIVVDGRFSGKLANQEQIGGRLRREVSFSPEQQSDIIKITARSGNPREAAILANKYAECYQEVNLDASRTRSKALREFLESQVKEQRSTLTKAEDSVKGFMETSGVVSMDGESNKIVEQLAQLEANRNAIDIDIQTLSQKLSSYEEQLPQQESNVASSIGQAFDPYIRLLQEQLAKLEVQRDVIVIQNDPQVLGQEMYNQRLKEIDDQISALRKKLQGRSKEFLESLLPGESASAQTDPLGYLKQLKQKILESKIELESLGSKRIALDRIIKQYEQKFAQIPRQSLELAKLQRTRMSTEKLYLLVEGKYNEVAITEKSEFGYVDIIDIAVVPGGPVSPNMKLSLIIGVLFGLGLGIAIVFIRDLLDVRIHTPEALQKRGYAALSEVAPMDKELRELRLDDKLPKEVRKFNEHLWLIFYPLSFLAESYRRLRTNVLNVQLDKPLKIILVTSPNPNEGKSTTICNLAIAFAETQKKVLLVDADLRRPTVHSLFGIAPKPGLSDLIYGKATFEEVVQRNVAENLDIISCGTGIRNPGKIFVSKNLQSFLEHMKQVYEWIFIDAPPILIVNDTAVLGSMVDGTIFVATAGNTRLATLDRASEFLIGAGGSVLGVVLNKFDARKTFGRYYGGQHYGHYGSNSGYYSSSNGKRTKRATRAS